MFKWKLSKVNELYFVSLLPLVLSVFYYYFEMFFGITLYQDLTGSLLKLSTFSNNINLYTETPRFCQVSFFVHIIAFPAQSIYWWVTGPKYVDISRFKKTWHFELGTFFMAACTFSLLFIPAMQVGMIKNLVPLYSNVIVFYLVFLMPVSLSSLLITRYVKSKTYKK